MSVTLPSYASVLAAPYSPAFRSCCGGLAARFGSYAGQPSSSPGASWGAATAKPRALPFPYSAIRPGTLGCGVNTLAGSLEVPDKAMNS
jgi:hypothetical protein